MEREACRAAMLPIFLCVSLSMQCFLGSLCLFRWKLLGSSAGLQEYSALARREPIGDVWGVRVDSADPVVRRVWTFTCDRARGAAIRKPTPAKGSTATRHRSKLVRVWDKTCVVRIALASCKALGCHKAGDKCSLHLLLGNLHRLRDRFSELQHRFWVRASIG